MCMCADTDLSRVLQRSHRSILVGCLNCSCKHMNIRRWNASNSQRPRTAARGGRLVWSCPPHPVLTEDFQLVNNQALGVSLCSYQKFAPVPLKFSWFLMWWAVNAGLFAAWGLTRTSPTPGEIQGKSGKRIKISRNQTNAKYSLKECKSSAAFWDRDLGWDHLIVNCFGQILKMPLRTISFEVKGCHAQHMCCEWL